MSRYHHPCRFLRAKNDKISFENSVFIAIIHLRIEPDICKFLICFPFCEGAWEFTKTFIVKYIFATEKNKLTNILISMWNFKIPFVLILLSRDLFYYIITLN